MDFAQTLQEMQQNVSIINKLIDSKGLLAVQKIHSTHHMIFLSCRVPGENIILAFGRGGGYEGLWCSPKIPASANRVKDRYLEFLRKYIKGRSISKITIEEDERILGFHGLKKDEKTLFSVFYLGRKSLFAYQILEKEENVRFFSGNTNCFEKLDSREFARPFLEIERKELKFKEKKDKEIHIKDYFGYIEATEEKKNKSFDRKLNLLKKEKEKVDQWSWIQDELLKNYETQTIVSKIAGLKIKFPKDWSDHQKRDLLFGKVKSLKKASEYLETKIGNLEKNHQSKQIYKNWKLISPEWKIDQKKTKIVRSEKTFKTFIFKSITFGIGGSAEENDQLRSRWASKKDYWFHLDGHTSAHLIAKTENIHDFSTEDLSALGSLIRDRSNLDILDVPLIFTQVKNLKGVKGRRGAVLFKKEKRIVVRYNKDWREIISSI